MKELFVDFGTSRGPVKPMHAVNNGPIYKFTADQRVTNMDAYKAAGIPFARTHDASFNATYGGEHTVDVMAIFPNFDADASDPASYDFTLTDEYLKVIEFAGTKVFYRLGHKIEHAQKKYGTLPPKDFKKWAVICEHIIRHYTEGWANGFHMDIDYWEIWNEPDMVADDAPPVNKKCWGGTKAQFFEFYEIAAKHLKSCFPNRKIGGPALCHDMNWAHDFLVYMAQREVPLDFFSWHIYSAKPSRNAELAVKVRAMLDETGYTHAESILNEWNYVKDWGGDAWLYSLKAEKSLKGASYTAAVMSLCQYAPVDMLMYYDARPCAMNGMFCTDWVCECLKGYYPFKMFNTLYTLGESVLCRSEQPHVYACAAKSETEAAVMLTYFQDDDTAEPCSVKLNLSGFGSPEGVAARFYLLDEDNDLALVREERLSGDDFSVYLTLTRQSSYLVRLEKLG